MVFRAVLAGCGQMARRWLEVVAETPELRDRIDLVGLVDVEDDAARRLADTVGDSAVALGGDLGAMLEAQQPDVLFDTVTPEARRSVVEAGLAAGCHVLSEKPMATSMDDARALVCAAKDAGRIHAVTQNRRFNDGVRRIRTMLDDGGLGALTAIHSDFFIGAHFGGFRAQMDNVLLVDMAIHTLDAARFMAARTPLAVYCQQSNPTGSWYAHGAAANAIFEFADGVIFTYRGSWSAEGANTSWDASWRIIGTEGTLLWDGGEGLDAHVVAGDEGFLRPLAPAPVPAAADRSRTCGHASALIDFLDCIETGRQPETASSDNLASLAMVFAAIESAGTGQRVAIQP